MSFKAAKCPNCAGDIQVPDDRDTVKCMYCGSDIVVREAIKLAGGVNIENLMMLAKNAEKSGRKDEAYKYYSTVLEQDPNNISAWIGKGFSHWLRQTSDGDDRYYSPDFECFRTAIEYAAIKEESKLNEVKQYINQGIVQRTFDHWGATANAQNIYECFLKPGVLANAYYNLLFIHEIDPNNDIGLIAVGFEKLLKNRCSETLVYFQKALSATQHKAIVTNIIVARLTEYYYVFQNTSQTQHAIEFVKRIKTGADIRPKEQAQAKEKCFIASAAYASPMAYEVTQLREFRDIHLVTNPWGKAFVTAYCHISPPIAGVISKSYLLRSVVRQLLRPIVYIVKQFMGRR